MLLYFPAIKIIRCDVIPKTTESCHIFHFKSELNSPKHYPSHPLIEGKVEFAEKIGSFDAFKFWCKYATGDNNPKNLKGKVISVLVKFDEHDSKKFILCGFGKKNDFAYFFHNRSLEVSPEESVAKLRYELKDNGVIERKKTKI